MQALRSSSPDFIYAIHGFLGESSDWDEVFKNIQPSTVVTRRNFFSDEIFTDLNLERFIHDIEKQTQGKIGFRKIFIGYSLGGRIGLKLLETRPDLFDHYIFISTHPGLTSDNDKITRLQADQLWIKKLQENSWENFLIAWNNQIVLKNSNTAQRSESHFKKNLLIDALSQYSLGHQKNYSALLLKYQDRITWIIGDQDTKFIDVAEDLKQKKILLDYKRIFSGHRVLLDNPQGLAIILESI